MNNKFLQSPLYTVFFQSEFFTKLTGTLYIDNEKIRLEPRSHRLPVRQAHLAPSRPLKSGPTSGLFSMETQNSHTPYENSSRWTIKHIFVRNLLCSKLKFILYKNSKTKKDKAHDQYLHVEVYVSSKCLAYNSHEVGTVFTASSEFSFTKFHLQNKIKFQKSLSKCSYSQLTFLKVPLQRIFKVLIFTAFSVVRLEQSFWNEFRVKISELRLWTDRLVEATWKSTK